MPVSDSASRLDGVVNALRLALGMSAGLDAVEDWGVVLRAAVAERCAALAWVRCGGEIAAHAPPDVTAAFRSHFASNAVRIGRMLMASQAAGRALERKGVYPIVLKGPPLAARLYGDSAARICSDLDWYVPAPMRAAVHETMLECGWSQVEGEQDGELCYGRDSHQGPLYLEVHSSLLHPRYSYLGLPAPTGRPMVVDGVPLIAHEDALLVGYLCTHLATHRLAPLAWLVDVLEVWERQDESARKEAQRAATAAGIGRYLTWGLERAMLLRRASLGYRGAAHSLGLREGWRVEPHPMWRHMALAPSVADTARAAWTWIAPAWTVGRRRGAFRATLRRVGAHWRDALPARRDVA